MCQPRSVCFILWTRSHEYNYVKVDIISVLLIIPKMTRLRSSGYLYFTLLLILAKGHAQIVCNFTSSTSNYSDTNETQHFTCTVSSLCCSNYDQHENVTAISFVSDEKFTYIPNQIFLTLPNLRIFDASNNTISEIIRDNFMKLTELEVINLSGNRLEKIPRDVFDDSLALLTVHLGEISSLSSTHDWNNAWLNI